MPLHRKMRDLVEGIGCYWCLCPTQRQPISIPVCIRLSTSDLNEIDGGASFIHPGPMLSRSIPRRLPRTILTRSLADSLLGHSPMAAPKPNTAVKSEIPTAKDTMGVWAPSSAKRDKIAELKTELLDTQETLDDAATPRQKLDLWWVDGLLTVARVSDDVPSNETLQQIDTTDWKVYLNQVIRQADQQLQALPTERCLKDVRNWVDATTIKDVIVPSDGNVENEFDRSVVRFRWLLTREVAQLVLDKGLDLVRISDADVDRAAVQGVTLEQATEIPLDRVRSLIDSYLRGTCEDRVDAWWALVDYDADGMLAEDEMNRVCDMALAPVASALHALVEESLEASPMAGEVPPSGWMARRRERKERRNINRMFSQTLKNHFEIEVEMPHRLRCIYAWSNKEHQDNKIESIMVDDAGWSGRKRYVELQPKISLSEFREVQKEHFQQMDRMAVEYLRSLREDILVVQGKGRQRQELIRDSSLFMVGVSVVDYIVTTM